MGYTQNILFGHENSNREGQYFWDDAGVDQHSDVFNTTGQYPGVFGYSFLEENADRLQAATLNGKVPTAEAIAADDYPVARSLFFYVKKAHVGVVPGIEGYIKEFTSERAWGPDGYLVDKGMIPLPDDMRAKMAKQAQSLKSMTGKEL